MPTGYTHDVAEGRVTEFAEFAMQCARAFGALITMRDAPMNADIPDEFPVDHDHHLSQIAELEAELLAVEILTPEQCDKAARNAIQKAFRELEERQQEKRAKRHRYEAMLAEVRAWTPPTHEHVELKKFMEQQLATSIDFDCDEKYMSTPKPMTGDEWRASEIARLRKAIDWDHKHYADEKERCGKRTAWVRALRDSLKTEDRECKH